VRGEIPSRAARERAAPARTERCPHAARAAAVANHHKRRSPIARPRQITATLAKIHGATCVLVLRLHRQPSGGPDYETHQFAHDHSRGVLAGGGVCPAGDSDRLRANGCRRTGRHAPAAHGARSDARAHTEQHGRIGAETAIPPKTEFYIVPEFGLELGALSRGVYSGPTSITKSVGFTTGIAALAFGARFGPVNLGIRYQGSYAGQTQLNDLQFHKVYGELGINWRREVFVASLFSDFGYSALVSNVVFMNGLGGKLGVGFDFYLARWFSLGPVASFDVQGFDTGLNHVWVNTLGASLFGRIGFHI
jgi:hypothetical protein